MDGSKVGSCLPSPLRGLKTSQRFKGMLSLRCLHHWGDRCSRREEQAGEEPEGSSISEEVQQDLEDKKNSSEFFDVREGVTLITSSNG